MLRLEAPPPTASALPTAPGPGSLGSRLAHGIRTLFTRADWEIAAGADWTARIMDQPVTDDFHAKQGRSTGRWVLAGAVPRLSVYLKRHYRLPWWHGLLATVWPGGAWSPGLRERRNLLWAAARGVPVPRVVAAGEWIGPWWRLRSFLAIEELVGMLPLHLAIPQAQANLPPPLFTRWKRSLATEMARLARLLHDRRRFHKDFYLCHFYIAADDTRRLPLWPGRVHLIDLHRLARHRLTWPVWLAKDLGGLLYSSDVAGVTVRDRVAFWRAYRRGSEASGALRPAARPTWFERFIAWSVGYKAKRYHRHNDKKRGPTEVAAPSARRAG